MKYRSPLHLYLCVLIPIIFADRGIGKLPILTTIRHHHTMIYKSTMNLIKINLKENGHLVVFAGPNDLRELHKLFPQVKASVVTITPAANFTFMDIPMRYKDTALIALSSDGPDLTHVLQHHLKDWRSPIVIMLTKIADEATLNSITRVLALYEKVNVAILAGRTSAIVDVYTFTAFHNCTQWKPYVIDTWTRHQFRVGKSIFPRNKNLTLGGCLQISCSLPMPPIVVFEKSGGKLEYTHFGRWLIDLLAKHLNFTYKIYSPNDREWGMVYANGSADGCVRDIMSRSADFIMGDIVNNPQRYLHVDFVRSVNLLCITWAVPPVDVLDQNIIKILFSGFTVDLWMMLFTGFVLSLFAFTLITKVRFGEAIFFLFGAMIDNPVGDVTTGTGPRFIALAWLFFSVVMNNLYRSQLLTLLSFPRKVEINTVEQVAATGLKIRAAAALRSTLLTLGIEMENPTMISLGNRTQIISDIWGSLQEVVKSQKSIMLMSGNVLSYHMKDKKLFDKPGGVHKSIPCLVNYPSVQFFFRRGSPIVVAFDRVVLRLQEAGIIQHRLDLEFLEKGLTELQLEHSLTLSQIGSVFNLLYAGYVLAFLVFLGELAHSWYRNRQRMLNKTSAEYPFLF